MKLVLLVALVAVAYAAKPITAYGKLKSIFIQKHEPISICISLHLVNI